MLQTTFWLAVAILLPGGAYILEVKTLHWLSEHEPPRALRPLLARLPEGWQQRQPPGEPIPPVLIALELRRIGDQINRVQSSDVPHKSERLQAWTGAYDLALLDLAASAELDLVLRAPLTADQRIEVEALCLAAGHDW